MMACDFPGSAGRWPAASGGSPNARTRRVVAMAHTNVSGGPPETAGQRPALPSSGRSRGLIAIAWWLFLAVVAQASITITRTSSPIFYSDIGHSLDAMYVSYQITNGDAVAYPSVYVTATNFSGGIVSLGGGDSGAHAPGALAAGQTKTACFFLKTTAGTGTAQT